MTDTLIADTERVRAFGRDIEYKWIVAAVYVSALFLDVLDVTIVNVALPQLGQQLKSDAVEWVVLGYTLALAVSIPAAGWWSDRVGTKRAFLISLGLFVGSSVLCGTAQNMTQLIAFRVVQGVGGGMLTPIGMSMMYRAFKPAERARAATIIMIPMLMAPALGPIIGGLIVTNIGWRWIFWVNLPIGIAAFAFGFKFLREARHPSAGSFDVLGFVLSGGGLALSLFALSEGPRSGWDSATVLVSGTIGLVAFVSFIVWELRIPEPMLDLRLFGNRMFRNANIVMAFAMAGFLGLLFVLPLYLQNLRGLTALRSGLATFPQALGVMISTLVASRLYRRIGPRRLVAFGMLGASVMMMGFTRVGADTSLWWIRGLMFSRGLMMGLCFMPMQAASYATISAEDTGRASSIFSAGRQIAISIGVAVLATVLSGYTSLAGAPADPARALHGYHVAFFVAVLFTAIAGFSALFLIKDEDAAGTR